MTTKSWNPAYVSNRLSRRRFLAGAAAGAGAAALIACGGSKDTVKLEPGIDRTPGSVLYARDSYRWEDETKEAVAGGTYPGVASADNTTGFDPYLGGQASSASTSDYEFMMRVNRGPGIKPGTVEYETARPLLAESVETQDAITFVFKMRRGVKFHSEAPVNGREMNIEDWRASLTRFLAVHPNSVEYKAVRDKEEFPDATTMVVKLKEPYAPLLKRLGEQTAGQFFFQIMPKELHDNPALAATKPIGTNYRFISNYQPSIGTEFKRFDEYWQGKPFIERWREPIVPEYSNRFAQFVSKNIITFTPTMPDALDLRRQTPEALMIAGQLGTDSLHRAVYGRQEKDTVPWGDPRVRIALHRAMNWDAVLGLLTNREKFVAAGVEVETSYNTHMPPDPSYWLDPRKGELGPDSQNYLYSVEEAKKLMSAAGHPNGIDMPMLAQTTSPSADIWPLYHDEIKKSGIVRFDLNLIADRTLFLDTVIRGNNFKGIGWFSSGSGGDVDYHVSRQYHRDGVAAAYGNQKLDDLVAAQRRELDVEKRAALLKDIQMEVAKVFPLNVGQHPFATFRFEWPWLHNAAYPAIGYGHLQWLDANTPNRNS